MRTYNRLNEADEKDFIKRMENENGYKLVKWLSPERGYVCVSDFAFTIGVMFGLDEYDYGGRWCYPKDIYVEAIVAFDLWDGKGDPMGDWVKYKGQDGERFNDNLKEKHIQ